MSHDVRSGEHVTRGLIHDFSKTQSHNDNGAAWGAPTLTLHPPVTHGMQVPVSIGENGTVVALDYTSTAPIPNGTTVTVSNFSNCYLWDATQQANPSATSATAAVVVGSDPTKGTATFLMGTEGAVGAVAGFSAQANDSASTKLTPDFASAPMTAVDSTAALFSLDNYYVSAWDGQNDAPSVQAIARIRSTDGTVKYPGVDVILIAQGFAEGVDAFADYIDVYDNSGNTLLTPSPYKATYQGNTYTTYRLQGDRNFGRVYVQLKPKAPQSGQPPIQGYVGLVGMFASSEMKSPGLFILNPTNPDPANLLPDAPIIDKRSGLCLRRGDTDTNATIWTRAVDYDITAYGLINYVQKTDAASLVQAVLAEDAAVVTRDGQQYVQWTVPLSVFNTCYVSSADHRCENCKNPDDLNILNYMVFEGPGRISSYSPATPFFLDYADGNVPHPPDQYWAAPSLFAGKYVGGQLVADTSQQIVSPTPITASTIQNGGLVIRVYDSRLGQHPVQGQIYLNGLNPHDKSQTRTILDLLKVPTVVQGENNPAGHLDIPLTADIVADYYYGGDLMSDAGFWVEYWDVRPNGNPGDYSFAYYTVLAAGWKND